MTLEPCFYSPENGYGRCGIISRLHIREVEASRELKRMVRSSITHLDIRRRKLQKCEWCHKEKEVYWNFHHPFVFGPEGTFMGWVKLCVRCKIKLAKSYN